MLVVDGIEFAYRGRPVFDGLDLEVRKGEIVGIVGPNGSGKTTLLRLISGILRPSVGHIRIDEQVVGELSSGRLARLVAVVPQNPTLPDGFTVLDLVLMARNPHLKLLQWERQVDLDIAVRAMEATETLDLADRPLGTVSGGERQRAVVAMALAQDTAVLLLDEPTSNLDLAHQTGVMDMVARVVRERGAACPGGHARPDAGGPVLPPSGLAGRWPQLRRGTAGEVLTVENIAAVYGTEVFVLSHPRGALR